MMLLWEKASSGKKCKLRWKQIYMKHSDPIAVIILAAGSIKKKYQSFSFIYDSPALVPIASRSTISFILDFYEGKNTRIYIAINQNDEELFRNELAYYKDIRLLTIQNSRGVCDTLAQVAGQITEDDVIVNLATTIPTVMPDMDTVLIDKEVSKHNHYSGVVCSSPLMFRKKNDGGILPFNAFTGVFRTAKGALIDETKALQESSDLLDIIVALNSRRRLDFMAMEWIDTGHEINYADARKKLISSRSFNAITVDNHTGILTKKSRNSEKLGQETRYVGMLPIELQAMYPRIFQGGSEGMVQMEYYGYPNLSEYQLYRAIEPMWWSRIFEGLEHSIKVMGKFTFSIGKEAFDQFYLDKTLNRIAHYHSGLHQDDVFIAGDSIIVNGQACKNINLLKDAIANRVKGLYREDDFCVMHGDLCFNNILYDTVSDTIKLIDPRGSFGEHCVGIYGDRKYDLAKLMHSTIGHYDYIVNNLFRLSETGSEVNYVFPLRDNQSTLDKLSEELLVSLGYDKKDILFIVGLLFLSMCPLHTDNVQRQRLMYAHGLFYINKYL
jgi:hypothetical protein